MEDLLFPRDFSDISEAVLANLTHPTPFEYIPNWQPSITLSFVDPLIGNVPREAKISHFTRLIFAHQNIAGCQITVNYLDRN